MKETVDLEFKYYKNGNLWYGNLWYGDHYNMNLISVDEDGTHRYENDINNNVMFISLLLMGDVWVLHDTKQPAYSTGDTHEFYVEGHPYHIEDMPIDNESKLMLKLKYGDLEYYDN